MTEPVYQRRRNLVRRGDGRLVNVARSRGQLFICRDGCCCGRTEDGFPPVPADVYHDEWERRRLRNVVHLTVGGCLGPCALANVVLLLFDGQALWFHSINTVPQVYQLYDYIDQMLDADGFLPPPAHLAPSHFTATAWQPRPDGQPIDDHRVRRAHRTGPARPVTDRRPAPPQWQEAAGLIPTPETVTAGEQPAVTESLDGCADPPPATLVPELASYLSDGDPRAAVPRKNGELVFDAPWEGRAFGMVMAMHEAGVFAWDEFRDRLIAHIAAAEQRDGAFVYYECWLAAFEELLQAKGLATADEVNETTFQFEFGERDEVF